ncbi:MAG: hypothetical protein EHM46_06660, partial [Bacteroidetes bacterium]
MKKTSGYISSLVMLLGLLPFAAAQDTLRTYGPRIGIDLARIPGYFTRPPEYGAEIWVDAELFRDVYPALELGYSALSIDSISYDYSSAGPFFRAGADYNFLSFADRSKHHSITAGFRLGTARFTHRADDISIPGNYWGEYPPGSYSHKL